MTDDLTPEVLHDETRQRYSLVIGDDTVGIADYVVTPREVRFTHTEIDPNRRGQGLAGILIEHALNDVSTNSRLTVVPQCPYVARWIDSHAEYQDLLTRGR